MQEVDIKENIKFSELANKVEHLTYYYTRNGIHPVTFINKSLIYDKGIECLYNILKNKYNNDYSNLTNIVGGSKVFGTFPKADMKKGKVGEFEAENEIDKNVSIASRTSQYKNIFSVKDDAIMITVNKEDVEVAPSEYIYDIYDKKYMFKKSEKFESLTTLQVMVFAPDEYKEEAENILKELSYKAGFASYQMKTSGFINFVIPSGDGGLTTTKESTRKIDLDIERHYNEDFKELHEDIMDSLFRTDISGVHVWHGVAGSGKTTLIRYLCHKLKDKRKVLYFAPNMTDILGQPDFIEFLQSHGREAVLIIEDCEEFIKSRDEYGSGKSPAVSNILNISDGIMSDMLNNQIILTFNTDKDKIDDALLRPQRLITSYSFGKLEINKAKELAEHIGIDPNNITKPMTTAEVYNLKTDKTKTYKNDLVKGNERGQVGFR